MTTEYELILHSSYVASVIFHNIEYKCTAV